jgi:hypothetical protein
MTWLPLVDVAAGSDEFNRQNIPRVIQAEQHTVNSDPQTKQLAAGQGFDMQSSIAGIRRHCLDSRQNLSSPVSRNA